MGYAAAPRVAFIVYGIQTFFTAIIIIIVITVYSQIHRKMKRRLRRSSLSNLSPDNKISLEHKLYIIHQKIKELSIPYKTFAK